MSDKHGKMTYEEAKALGFLDDPEQPDGIAKTVQKLHENLKAVEKERIDGIVAERTAEIQKQLDIADERLDQETPEIARLKAEVAELKKQLEDYRTVERAGFLEVAKDIASRNVCDHDWAPKDPNVSPKLGRFCRKCGDEEE